MGNETEENSPEKRRGDWLNRLAVEFEALKLIPDVWANLWEEGCPTWVQNVQREVARVGFPIARLKGAKVLTPGLIGGVLGNQCAYAVWMMEFLHEEIAKEKTSPPGKASLTKEEVRQLEAGLNSCGDWYSGLRKLAKRALCSSVDQEYGDMAEFLRAYAAGFARKPKGSRTVNIGSTTFEVYVLLLVNWRRIESFDSVRQLHAVLGETLGQYRAGELKRLEKLCQRIGKHFPKKPGRPRKPQ